MNASLTLFAVTASAGILGLVIGSFLNVVVYRVPAGVSLLRQSRCPACAQPVRWAQNVPVLSWLLLRGRCAACRAPIAIRYPLVELSTGLVFAGVAAWWALALPVPGEAVTVPLGARLAVLAAYLWFAASGIALTLIDLDVHRLPHAVTGTAFAGCLTLLTLAWLLGAEAEALGRALAGAVALYAFYAILRLARPGGMGGGDVRLAAVVGLMLGWLGWWPLLVGAFAAFLLGGVFGVSLLIRRRASRRSTIPFGPWIIAGAWVGVLAGEVLGGAYASMHPALSAVG